MARRDWKNTGAFNAWVEKWKIGSSMNDFAGTTRRFVNETLPGTRTAEMFDIPGIDDRLKRGLYSGFDGTVGEGWVPILDRLAEDLVKLGWDRDLHQVKEKFGTLRFYVGAETPEMTDRIQRAEDESAITCENCGAPGEARRGGWIKTLCDECSGTVNS